MNHFCELAEAIQMFEGSMIEIKNPMKYNLMDMAYDTMIPFLYKGSSMIMVAGREM